MNSGRIVVGDAEVLVVTDATEVTSRHDLYPSVSGEQWRPYLDVYSSRFVQLDRLNWNYTCYVVRVGARTILVDAGIGGANGAVGRHTGLKGQLLERLRALGIRATDVDTVVLTHLHPDHVGWTVVSEGAKPRIAFPNAVYIAHRADWDVFWMHETQAPFAPGYVEWCLGPLRDQNRVSLIEGAIMVAPSVQLEHAPGHTPGSIVVRIGDESSKALLIGDVIAHPAQLSEMAWDYVWDMDPTVARKTRRRILGELPDGLFLGAAHFGLGQIEKQGDGSVVWKG